MKEYNIVSRKGIEIEKTVDIKKLIGKIVLSKGGTIVGKVYEIRLNPDNLELEGIVVKRSLETPIYIGRSYFSTLSEKAIILNTELSYLLNGKKVISIDGKLLGRVTEVKRKGLSNEIEYLIVKSLWKKYTIPNSEIKQFGNSIIVKRKYEAAKNYLRKGFKQDSNL